VNFNKTLTYSKGYNMSFSDRLIELRSHFGFKTQQELANFIEVARQTVQNMEKGSGKASFEILLSLKQKIPQLNLNWLIAGEETMLLEKLQKPANGILNFNNNIMSQQQINEGAGKSDYLLHEKDLQISKLQGENETLKVLIDKFMSFKKVEK
jgi:DNA-binding XRE family transcriptional regulator